jgi:rhodanese-related sulfurtransferase
MSDNVRITLNELRKRMDAGEQFTFIDTRNPQAWGESDEKVPGALRMTLNDFQNHFSELPRNKPIVAYCT